MNLILALFLLFIGYRLFNSEKIIRTEDRIPGFLTPGKVFVGKLIFFSKGEQAAEKYEDESRHLFRKDTMMRQARIWGYLATIAGVLSLIHFLLSWLLGY
jgi:hypothetical protein